MKENLTCSVSSWFDVVNEADFLVFCDENYISLNTREATEKEPGKFRYINAEEGLERFVDDAEGDAFETDVALMIAPFITDDWTVIFVEHEREGEGWLSMKAIAVKNWAKEYADEIELFHSDSLLQNFVQSFNDVHQKATLPYDLR